MKDYGSRDTLFLDAVSEVRNGLLRAAGTSQQSGCECVIVQGSGTFGVESVLGSVAPRRGQGKVLVLINGAYGTRQLDMCQYLNIDAKALEYSDRSIVDIHDCLQELRADSSITHVSLIHHETTAGVLNPLRELAKAVKAEFPQVEIIVDSMSGFGAYELRMDWGIDFAVSSANKCIEGVPGFSFALCNRNALERTKGNGRSLSMDLYAQWANMEKTRQFRFTPPTHAILAFQKALQEWEAEGGHSGRLKRYEENYNTIKEGMESMGFSHYVSAPLRSALIMTWMMPSDRSFDFNKFYNSLAARGCVIYPGKTTEADTFRIGTIGRLYPHDCEKLLLAIREACAEMGVALPLNSNH